MESMAALMNRIYRKRWEMDGQQGTLEEFIEKQQVVSEKERVEHLIEQANSKPGDIDAVDGYYCKKCLNRGYTLSLFEYNGTFDQQAVQCDCWKVRKAIRRMKKSGLENSLRKLSDFETKEDWQRHMLENAKAYLNADKKNGESFFIGGAVGCGKTFICSAICRELLHAGNEVIYMPWVTEAAKLKALANDESLAENIAIYAKCEYLYIDDFFKPTGTNTAPTSADVRLAYDIINYRYINRLPMIISSEKYSTELMEYDEATISRIYERAKGFTINVGRRANRNYRMKDANEVI